MSLHPVPHIDPSLCTGCGRCVAACPWHLLSLETKGWLKSAVIHNYASCTSCTKCEPVCPFHAIKMEPYAPDLAEST